MALGVTPSTAASAALPRLLLQDYLDALIGICYDGVEGLLYLVLFSLLVAASFSTIICATPRAWKHFAGRWVCPRPLPARPPCLHRRA